MKYTSDAVRIRFWKDQDGICPLCERPILDPLNRDRNDPEACNIDHKIPQSHDGTDSRSNLQLTHIPCNSAKGCGCPPGDAFHLHGRLPQVAWRAQNFRCALCGEPINPSDINDHNKARMFEGGLSHAQCIESVEGLIKSAIFAQRFKCNLCSGPLSVDGGADPAKIKLVKGAAVHRSCEPA